VMMMMVGVRHVSMMMTTTAMGSVTMDGSSIRSIS